MKGSTRVSQGARAGAPGQAVLLEGPWDIGLCKGDAGTLL